ncbi:MAG: lysozyme [Rhodopila sp.]|jgi:lysozyme
MNIQAALSHAVTIVNGAEGFTANAFLDTMASPETWTIGHGTTRIAGAAVQSGMVCTRQQADGWAMTDMTQAAHYVLREVTVTLNEYQLGALISFCYNIGDGNFRSSSVLEALNLGLYSIAADRLLEYDEAGGVVRGGLQTRRGRERALFLLGIPRTTLTLASARARAAKAAAQAAAAETAREDAETDALNQAELDRIAKGT